MCIMHDKFYSDWIFYFFCDRFGSSVALNDVNLHYFCMLVCVLLGLLALDLLMNDERGCIELLDQSYR